MIPLSIHTIRIIGPDSNSTHHFYHTASAMQRFFMLLAKIKEIIPLAKNDPNTLHLISCPEGTVSSNWVFGTICNQKQYDKMVATLGLLVQDLPNVLLMPGTFVFPLQKKKTLLNPAPIFYQNKCFEYFQSFAADPAFNDPVLFLKIKPAFMPQKKWQIEFKGIPFTLFPQICIEHLYNSLFGVPGIGLANTLQVVLSNSVELNPAAVLASAIVHVDIDPFKSSVWSRCDSIFSIKAYHNHCIDYSISPCTSRKMLRMSVNRTENDLQENKENLYKSQKREHCTQLSARYL